LNFQARSRPMHERLKLVPFRHSKRNTGRLPAALQSS
jgi:hypothetical protein